MDLLKSKLKCTKHTHKFSHFFLVRRYFQQVHHKMYLKFYPKINANTGCAGSPVVVWRWAGAGWMTVAGPLMEMDGHVRAVQCLLATCEPRPGAPLTTGHSSHQCTVYRGHQEVLRSLLTAQPTTLLLRFSIIIVKILSRNFVKRTV